MTKSIRYVGAVPASFLAACSIGGIRVALDRFDEMGPVGAVAREFKTATDEMSQFATGTKKTLDGVALRLTDIEQKMARRGGDPNDRGPVGMSPGRKLVESDEFKTLVGRSDQRGRASVEVETKALTGVSGSALGLVPVDNRTDPVMLPRKRLTIRDLVARGETASNMVYYVRQTLRSLNAAPVAENPSAAKPRSDLQFEQIQAAVRTIAHYIKASRQIMDDAPALQSIVDAEMRYGLADVEDQQLLLGDGTGMNLLGLMPQATPFAAPFPIASPTPIDVLLQAIAQAEAALLPATGIVLNVIDWLQIVGQKDTQGRYLSSGPFGPGQTRSLWDLPIAPTTQMPPNNFLVGAFKDGAQIFDRATAQVLISTENEDDFIKNMVTILCEERLAFTVKRPQAFVKGLLRAA